MSTHTVTSQQRAERRTDDRPSSPDRRWWILAVIAIAQLMIVLDTTIINVALPSAQADLAIVDGQQQWLVTAYALAFGSLLLFGGRVGDLFGRKRTFIGALVAFALASALAGAAPSFGVLVTARAIQGVAAAMLAPAALSMLITTFSHPRDRGRAFSIFSTVAVGGGAVGLLLGGVLTEYLSWRWTMYVNVVFAAVASIGAIISMVGDRPTSRARLDVVGAALASGALFSLAFGFSHAETAGWTSLVTLTSLILGVALLVAFGVAERRVLAPLLPLRIVSNRSRAAAFVALAISGFGMFGLFLFLTYYLQTVRGFSPVMSGLAFLPMIACVMISANLANTVTLPRLGPRVVITTGMAVGGLALAGLSRLDAGSSYAEGVLPSLIGMGLGMGMIVSPAMSTATVGVQPGDAGAASALVNTMQQVGGSIGTAVLSTIAATVSTTYTGEHGSAVELAAEAATHGFTVAFAVSAGAFAVGAVLGASLFPSKVRLAQMREAAEASAAVRAPAPDPNRTEWETVHA